METIRCEITVCDDGVQVAVRRGYGKFSLLAFGIALHEGKGPEETTRRAIADARAQMKAEREAIAEQGILLPSDYPEGY